mgnify:CR=1 FL=1
MDWLKTRQEGKKRIIVDGVQYTWWGGANNQYVEGTKNMYGVDQSSLDYSTMYVHPHDNSQLLSGYSMEQQGFSKDPDAPPEATIGETEDFGMESFTYGMYKDKTPWEMAEYIFQVKYDSKVPQDSAFKGKPTEFIKSIVDELEDAAPQLGRPATEEVGFLAEQYGGATQADDPSTPDIDESQTGFGEISFAESITGQKAGMQREQDIYALQSEAYKFAPAVSTGTGMGSGMRASIAGQEAIGKGFDVTTDQYGLTKDVAGFDYKKGMYGLEKGQIGAWETNFKTFLGSLPDAG